MHDIASRQVKDSRLNLETNAFGAGQVSQNGVESVARAGERIDHAYTIATRRTSDNFGDICPDLVAKRVFHSFEARAC